MSLPLVPHWVVGTLCIFLDDRVARNFAARWAVSSLCFLVGFPLLRKRAWVLLLRQGVLADNRVGRGKLHVALPEVWAERALWCECRGLQLGGVLVSLGAYGCGGEDAQPSWRMDCPLWSMGQGGGRGSVEFARLGSIGWLSTIRYIYGDAPFGIWKRSGIWAGAQVEATVDRTAVQYGFAVRAHCIGVSTEMDPLEVAAPFVPCCSFVGMDREAD